MLHRDDYPSVRADKSSMKSFLIHLIAAALMLGATCTSEVSEADRAQPDRATHTLSDQLQRAVTINGIREHLQVFQDIADANGGTRASGTRGYDESARYVGGRLREAGYAVTFQEFVFPVFFEEREPRLALTKPSHEFDEGDEFVTMLYSGSGDVAGPIVAVDFDLAGTAPTSGCDSTDFDGFPPGGVALMMRSNCFYRDQAGNAGDAGAVAALVMPTKQDALVGVVRGTLTPEASVDIPVMGVSYSAGRLLVRKESTQAPLAVTVDATTEETTTTNVLAENDSGDDSRVVMIGGHLDSVPAGPGINDNGSGTATILEIAEEMADHKTPARVRYAFWGAEEFGLLGSIHYVENLGDEKLQAIDAYLNFDMLGSPNFVRFIYDGRRSGASDSSRSVEIQRIFEEHFEDKDLATELVPLRDRSDHALFAANGVDIGGLFSGADEIKTRAEMRAYGGRAGKLHDPCYHLPCDTIENVNFKVLEQMADAVAAALVTLAGAGD
jgi:Zn-dependent M28 family amino/carboxypeptidase